MAQKAWAGRFSEGTDPRVERFTESISFDYRLAAVDVRGSTAHARMLAKVGLLTAAEAEQIASTLQQILVELQAGQIPFRTDLEDIHLHIESALTERLGDLGRKLHTGRSRNDQVATDLKLYVRGELERIDGLLSELQAAFVSRDVTDHDVVLPGYTHLQRAQPVMAMHYWLAWCEKLERDRLRLADCLTRVNISPLGAAALAGTSLPIDRHFTANELGFTSPAANSLDVSSDRDFLAESLFVLSLIAIHLSSWAEEWILWCTTEFSLLELPDAYTTGSSIMPQKRNPDVLELIRGKSAGVVGNLQRLLVLLKGLPTAYNRDLQEDKLAFFDASETVASCLELAAAVVGRARLRVDRINARLEEGFLDATTLMEYLIVRGVPMRTGHETVGRLVKLCEERGCRLAELPLSDLQAACPLIAADVSDWLGVRNVVERLASYGSGGRKPVREQVAAWQARLKDRTQPSAGS